MIDYPASRALLAVAQAYQGKLPPHLVNALCEIAESPDLPHHVRRDAVGVLRRNK